MTVPKRKPAIPLKKELAAPLRVFDKLLDTSVSYWWGFQVTTYRKLAVEWISKKKTSKAIQAIQHRDPARVEVLKDRAALAAIRKEVEDYTQNSNVVTRFFKRLVDPQIVEKAAWQMQQDCTKALKIIQSPRSMPEQQRAVQVYKAAQKSEWKPVAWQDTLGKITSLVYKFLPSAWRAKPAIPPQTVRTNPNSQGSMSTPKPVLEAKGSSKPIQKATSFTNNKPQEQLSPKKTLLETKEQNAAVASKGQPTPIAEEQKEVKHDSNKYAVVVHSSQQTPSLPFSEPMQSTGSATNSVNVTRTSSRQELTEKQSLCLATILGYLDVDVNFDEKEVTVDFGKVNKARKLRLFKFHPDKIDNSYQEAVECCYAKHYANGDVVKEEMNEVREWPMKWLTACFGNRLVAYSEELTQYASQSLVLVKSEQVKEKYQAAKKQIAEDLAFAENIQQHPIAHLNTSPAIYKTATSILREQLEKRINASSAERIEFAKSSSRPSPQYSDDDILKELNRSISEMQEQLKQNSQLLEQTDHRLIQIGLEKAEVVSGRIQMKNERIQMKNERIQMEKDRIQIEKERIQFEKMTAELKAKEKEHKLPEVAAIEDHEQKNGVKNEPPKESGNKTPEVAVIDSCTVSPASSASSSPASNSPSTSPSISPRLSFSGANSPNGPGFFSSAQPQAVQLPIDKLEIPAVISSLNEAQNKTAILLI